MIYTWGYGNRSVGELLDLIDQCSITAVIDVRRSPHSRNRGFERDALCRDVPGYECHQELGNRRGAVGEWQPMARDEADDAMAELACRVRAGERLLLLCCEVDAHGCHRAIIAAQLTRMTGTPHEHIWDASQELAQVQMEL